MSDRSIRGVVLLSVGVGIGYLFAESGGTLEHRAEAAAPLPSAQDAPSSTAATARRDVYYPGTEALAPD